jgi:hydrogenase expression/formation protein HypE
LSPNKSQENQMDIGKLPHRMLGELLSKLQNCDPRVLVGPGIGLDAAVIDMGGSLLVAKTDPITFATDRIGWYAVNINANDIAVCGAEPRWFMASVLLPPGASAATAAEIFEQMQEACKALNASLVGGHTEVTYGLDRPIVVGCMLGEAEPERVVTAGGAQPGDKLLLVGEIAVEGCAVLAREMGEYLMAKGVPPSTVDRAMEFLDDPGISVVAQARTIASTGAVHAMHDPTEGGIATALREMAVASNVGLRVHRNRIRILKECREICAALGIDPLGLLASGSLLAAVPSRCSEEVLNHLSEAGFTAEVIGEVTPPESGLTMQTNGGEVPLPDFPRDELARVFEAADGS